MFIALSVFLALFLAIVFILSVPAFGRLPERARLQKIIALPNYSDGELKNLSPTPVKPENISYWAMLSEFFFGKHPRRRPSKILPHAVPDFSAVAQPKITWFGHSSYLLQIEGINILVDPVFGPTPSPFRWLGSKNFKGMAFLRPEELPPIDIVLLSHDHYDHLDHKTILKLRRFNPLFIAALGVGAHLERWGITPAKITELAWGESVRTLKDINITATSARHFSGRKFKRNQCVWAGFVVKAANYSLYLGGDSGYDTHFKEIGAIYGPFDIAVLECGQYNEMWPLIHMFPEQMIQASIDLKAKITLPVHWGKFTLALHPWDEPIERAVKAARAMNVQLTTPLPGEAVIIDSQYPDTMWWRD